MDDLYIRTEEVKQHIRAAVDIIECFEKDCADKDNHFFRSLPIENREPLVEDIMVMISDRVNNLCVKKTTPSVKEQLARANACANCILEKQEYGSDTRMCRDCAIEEAYSDPIYTDDVRNCAVCGDKVIGEDICGECIDYAAKKEPESEASSTFTITEESPDDLTVWKDGEKILMISLPEQSTQWNTRLP